MTSGLFNTGEIPMADGTQRFRRSFSHSVKVGLGWAFSVTVVIVILRLIKGAHTASVFPYQTMLLIVVGLFVFMTLIAMAISYEARRTSRRYAPIISLAMMLTELNPAAKADDPSYDAAVYREIQSANPQLNRMIGAATQESTWLALGGLAPQPWDFEALLGHRDSRFTTFSDQKVSVTIRYLEFMRQDLLRTLEPMQEFGRKYQKCGVLRPLTPDNLVNATYRADTLRTLHCAQGEMSLALKASPDIAKSEDAKVAPLKLPPRTEAAVRQYFAQRAAGWAEDNGKAMQGVTDKAHAIEDCVKFVDEHQQAVHAINGQLVFDDPTLLAGWQPLERRLEMTRNSR